MTEYKFDPTVNPTGDELTAYEKEFFNKIKWADNIAMMRCTLDGVQRAAVCQIGDFEDGDVWISPLAIIILPEEVGRLIDSEGQTPRPFTDEEFAEVGLEDEA